PAVGGLLQLGDATGDRRDLQLVDLVGLDAGEDLRLVRGCLLERLLRVDEIEVRDDAAEEHHENNQRPEAPHLRLRAHVNTPAAKTVAGSMSSANHITAFCWPLVIVS